MREMVLGIKELSPVGYQDLRAECRLPQMGGISPVNQPGGRLAEDSTGKEGQMAKVRIMSIVKVAEIQMQAQVPRRGDRGLDRAEDLQECMAIKMAKGSLHRRVRMAQPSVRGRCRGEATHQLEASRMLERMRRRARCRRTCLTEDMVCLMRMAHHTMICLR